MVEIKGIGDHTVKERTSFDHLRFLLSEANTHIVNGNFLDANTKLDIIDNIFPLERKTQEYQENLMKINDGWKKIDLLLTAQLNNAHRFLEKTDAQSGLTFEFARYVRFKYQITEELFVKGKLFENEPREYEP